LFAGGQVGGIVGSRRFQNQRRGRIAKLGGDRVRRVVLLDEDTRVPPAVEFCEVGWNAGARAQPRLRDGRWVRA
jgi:hypothetical protein